MPEPEPLFETPYWACIFTSARSAGIEASGPDASGDSYAEMAAEMDVLAREQPGYLGIESARGADGLGITVSYWRTMDDARAWKRVAAHREAQRLGRERWYASYRVRVARVERDYGFDRPPA